MTSSLEPGYTAVQAARITKLTRRRLDTLAAHGLVVPSLVRPGGRRRHYTFTQLVELRTIRELTDGEDRTSLGRIRAVVEALREVRERPLLETLVVRDGNVLWVDSSADALVDVLRGFQSVLLFVNVHAVEAELEHLIRLDGLPLPVRRAA